MQYTSATIQRYVSGYRMAVGSGVNKIVGLLAILLIVTLFPGGAKKIRKSKV